MSINATGRLPTEKPAFTIATLRNAIPAHCFERSLTRSCAYLVADVLLVAALFGFSQLIETKFPIWLAAVAWPVYWFFQVTPCRHAFRLNIKDAHICSPTSSILDATCMWPPMALTKGVLRVIFV
jgi:hypothetical protein